MNKTTGALIGISFLLAVMILGRPTGSQPGGERRFDVEFEDILTQSSFDEQWEGNPEYWRFEDGILIGEVTPDKIMIENTFLVWEGDTVTDFELKVDYRISSGGNSGINYRSEAVEGGEYVLRGYQADIDGQNRHTGQVYEEKGRSFLARRGKITHIDEDNSVTEIGSLGNEEDLTSVLMRDGWNELHLVVRGNTLMHTINGRVMSVAIDDGVRRKREGVLGLQLHRGPPMKVEFRNLQLKQFR